MRKILCFYCLVIALLFGGCGTTKVATRMGDKIGDRYQEAAELGLASAEKSIAAWPYVSGVIDGLLADNFEFELPVIAKGIIGRLDELSKKEALSEKDKGVVIGSICRLEVVAMQFGWDKYGISVFNMFFK